MTRGLTAKKLLRNGSIILLFVIIIGYGLWRSTDLLFGIKLSVSDLEDGQSVTEPVLTLSGKSKHAVGITINGMTAPISEDGVWRDTIALLPGYNVMTIIATDKFDKTVSKQFRLYYDAPEPPPSPDPVIEEPPSDIEETPPETTDEPLPEIQEETSTIE